MLIFPVIAFQNCGRARITEYPSSLNSLSESSSDSTPRETDIQFKEIFVPVDVNQSKTLELITNTHFNGIVSFDEKTYLIARSFKDQAELSLSADGKGHLVFEPAFGYRGSLSVPVYVKYNDLKIEVIKVTFQVQNPLRDFRPSLVVRAAECMLCHANIKGDIISDFGYRGPWDPTGPDMFFKVNKHDANSSLAYSAGHSGNSLENTGWGTAKISGSVIVPEASLVNLANPESRKFVIPLNYTDSGQNKIATRLQEYLDKILFADKSRVKSIQSLDAVYIGAPTAEDIRKAGRLSAKLPLQFIKNDNDKPALKGFERVTENGKDYYTNVGVVTCDGDIFVDGVVLLDNLSLRTELGCRIHATKTVFIQGPIEYLDEYALSNLQVLSARAIYMGMGMCYDCYNDGYERTNVNFAADRANNVNYWANSLRNQADLSHYVNEFREDFLKVSNEGQLTRAPAGTADLAGYYLPRIEAAGIKLLDAGNPFRDTSDTSYRRLLLNAPDVQSRYNGKFQGTIIAEFALWRLGKFSFQFDSVFTAVPIFPLMDLNKIIRVGSSSKK